MVDEAFVDQERWTEMSSMLRPSPRSLDTVADALDEQFELLRKWVSSLPIVPSCNTPMVSLASSFYLSHVCDQMLSAYHRSAEIWNIEPIKIPTSV